MTVASKTPKLQTRFHTVGIHNILQLQNVPKIFKKQGLAAAKARFVVIKASQLLKII
jgi:hypothetical protein